MKDLAPIVLFVYNRPWHTQQTIEALQKNDLASDSELFIYSDGARDAEVSLKVNEVREFIKSISGFKRISILERDRNWGLADNIVDGVTEIVNKYGKIIVLEDDIVTSRYFLLYMNEGLIRYLEDKTVMHISGFLPTSKYSFILQNTFFLRYMSCWGWGTWKDSWNRYEHDPKLIWKKINQPAILKDFNIDNTVNFHEQLIANLNGIIRTWAIKWFSTIFINNGLCLYPKKSLVINIGQDGSGINYNDNNANCTYAKLTQNRIKLKKKIIKESQCGRFYLRLYYSRQGNKTPFYRKIYYKIYKLKSFIWTKR